MTAFTFRPAQALPRTGFVWESDTGAYQKEIKIDVSQLFLELRDNSANHKLLLNCEKNETRKVPFPKVPLIILNKGDGFALWYFVHLNILLDQDTHYDYDGQSLSHTNQGDEVYMISDWTSWLKFQNTIIGNLKGKITK